MKQKATQITYEKYTIDEKKNLSDFNYIQLDVFNFLLPYYSNEIPNKCYCFNCFIN